MTDFWTSTRGPAGYGLFQRALEWTLENKEEASEINMLDIGSADGEGLNSLAQSLEESTGKNIETYALEPQSVINEDEAAGLSDNVIRGMAGHQRHGMPFQEDSFDIVVSNNLLPFLDQKQQSKALQDIHEVMDKEGYVALHVRPCEEASPERWVMHYKEFDSLYRETEEFTEAPLEIERSENLYHSDSRSLLPEGFYDDFYESR